MPLAISCVLALAPKNVDASKLQLPGRCGELLDRAGEGELMEGGNGRRLGAASTVSQGVFVIIALLSVFRSAQKGGVNMI